MNSATISQTNETASRLPNLSLVVPVYNEEETIDLLFDECHRALKSYNGAWELVIVNDGSSDNTRSRLDECVSRYGEHVHVIHFKRNFGQTAAMQAGIDAARGEIIATMDGDLQNDPADIPRMVAELLERDLDLLTGWRKNRQDNTLSRKLPSLIANKIIRRFTGVKVRDYGCSLKVYRADVIKQIRLIGEMHRFIPAWIACVTSPSRIDETPVNHRSRQFGTSKYGISRSIRVVLDLISVIFFMRFSQRPGHFFGPLGLLLSVVGSSLLGYLLFVKIFLAQDIGSRPMLFAGILLLVTGVQLITTGVLAELQTRSNPVSPASYVSSGNNDSRPWADNTQDF